MMTKEEKKRLHSIITKTLSVLCIGIAYVIFVSLTNLGIPCVFRLITDMDCPGCGVSRMFLALIRLDIVTAARYNLLVLCLIPFGITLFSYKSWQYIKKGDSDMAVWEKVFYTVAFVLCVVFFILRNSGAIPFLTMP